MEIREYIVVRYGELFLKGQNRHFFVQKLINNLKKMCQKNNFPTISIKKFFDCLIIGSEDKNQLTLLIPHLEKVFGISVFYLAHQLDSDLEHLYNFVRNLTNYYEIDFNTFKFDISRNYKNYLGKIQLNF